MLAQHKETATITIEGNMTRRTIEQRLAQLETQKKTLQCLGKQNRARDTRRKVLLGALILHRLQSDKPEASTTWSRTWLTAELPAFLTRDIDKALLVDLMAALDTTEIVSPSNIPKAEVAARQGALERA